MKKAFGKKKGNPGRSLNDVFVKRWRRKIDNLTQATDKVPSKISGKVGGRFQSIEDTIVRVTGRLEDDLRNQGLRKK